MLRVSTGRHKLFCDLQHQSEKESSHVSKTHYSTQIAPKLKIMQSYGDQILKLFSIFVYLESSSVQ